MRQIEKIPSLVAKFIARAAQGGDKPILWHKHGDAWVEQSWADAARQVASLAAGLKTIGLQPGDRVMLVSENRPEWCISDLAIMAAGCVTVPTYITNTERDHTHILETSGARAVIVSNAKLARPLLPAAIRASEAKIVIGIDDLRVMQTGTLDYYHWPKLIADHPTDPADVATIETSE